MSSDDHRPKAARSLIIFWEVFNTIRSESSDSVFQPESAPRVDTTIYEMKMHHELVIAAVRRQLSRPGDISEGRCKWQRRSVC